jgi:hypothetical protein
MKKRLPDPPQPNRDEPVPTKPATVSQAVKTWQEENREAIESYNRFIAEHGIWGKKYRSW